MIDALVLDASDNVATALRDLRRGAPVVPRGPGNRSDHITLLEPVAAGHKLALVPIAQGDDVRKYGEVIGVAKRAIAPGAHVHVHNVTSRRARSPSP